MGFKERLDEALRAVPDMSAPSTTKFDPVRKVCAECCGLDIERTHALFVSKPGNLNVRFKQPGVTNRRPALALAIIKQAEDLPASLAPGQRLVGPSRNIGALAYCVRGTDDSWTVAAMIEAPNGALAPLFRREFASMEVIAPTFDTEERQPDAPLPRPEKATDLAESLLLDPNWLEDVLWLLEDKKALVFYGPPGTGKTYLATRIAHFLQPNPALVSLVQLHPSYGYEDFFEGYRPVARARESRSPGTLGSRAEEQPSPLYRSSGLSLEKRDGPLRALAREAALHPDEPALLVLDEMNRGNLPKVFGELFFLLEYRKESTTLMYSPDEHYRLPPNLSIIGTMNTADRSIAVLDQALRRRFHFVGLFPGEYPVNGLLRQYLQKNTPQMLWVADLLDEANARLGDRNASIGPSHFMRKDLDDAILRRIWRHSVLPSLEEHFYGNISQLDELRLDRLRADLEIKSEEDAEEHD